MTAEEKSAVQQPAAERSIPAGQTFSPPGRLAAADEGISEYELQLAARNHGIPLEALRYDITPIGLHYLLIHYDIPDIELLSWRLRLGGLVKHALSLELDEIRARSRVTTRVTMECAGNGRATLEPRPVSQPWLVEAVGTAEWTGTPLAPLLRAAVPDVTARDVVFTGADHGSERGIEQTYQRSLSLAQAMDEEVLLAYEMNGMPLLPQHGAPVRLVVPGWYGMAQVKWLQEITVIAEEFTGFQQATAYRLRTESGERGIPVERMVPRALLIPPGWPDFMSRTRFLHPGPVDLQGRAWSGYAPVHSVEVSTDDGATWQPAVLDPSVGRWAWRGWRLRWSAKAGEHVLAVRATDESGRAQPTEAPWNRGGFANNLVHRVPVVVIEP